MEAIDFGDYVGIWKIGDRYSNLYPINAKKGCIGI